MAVRREVNVKWSFEDKVTSSLKNLRKHFKDTAAEAKTAKQMIRPLGKEIKAISKEVESLGKTSAAINKFYKSLARSTAAKAGLTDLTKSLGGSKSALVIFRTNIKNAEDALRGLNTTLDKGGLKKKDKLGLEKQRETILDYIESLKVLRNEAEKSVVKAKQPKVSKVEAPEDLKKAIDAARKKVTPAAAPPGDESKRISRPTQEQEEEAKKKKTIMDKLEERIFKAKQRAGRIILKEEEKPFLQKAQENVAKRMQALSIKAFKASGGFTGTGLSKYRTGIAGSRRGIFDDDADDRSTVPGRVGVQPGAYSSLEGKSITAARMRGLTDAQKAQLYVPDRSKRVIQPKRKKSQLGAYGRQTVGPPRPPRRPLGGLGDKFDKFKDDIRTKIIIAAFDASEAISNLNSKFAGLGPTLGKIGAGIKRVGGGLSKLGGTFKSVTDGVTKYTRKMGLVAFMLSFTSRRILRDYKQIITAGKALITNVSDVDGAFSSLTDIMSKLALGGELTGGRSGEVTDLMMQWFDVGSKVQAQFAIISLAFMRLGPAILRGILPGLESIAWTLDRMITPDIISKIQIISEIFMNAFAIAINQVARALPGILDALKDIAPSVAAFTIGIGEGALIVIDLLASLIKIAPWMEQFMLWFGRALIPAIALLVPISGLAQVVSVLGSVVSAAMSPIALITAALAGLLYVFTDLDAFGIREMLDNLPWDEMWKGADKALVTLRKLFWKKIDEIWKGIGQRLGLIEWDKVDKDAMITFTGVKDKAQEIFGQLKTVVQEQLAKVDWEDLKTRATDTWTDIKTRAETAWTDVTTKLDTVWADIDWDAMGEDAGALTEKAGTFLLQLGDDISSVDWGQLADDAAEQLTTMAEDVDSWAKPIVTALEDTLGTVDWLTVIKEWVASFVEWWTGTEVQPVNDAIEGEIKEISWEDIVTTWVASFVKWWGVKTEPLITAIEGTLVDAFEAAWRSLERRLPEWFKKAMGIKSSKLLDRDPDAGPGSKGLSNIGDPESIPGFLDNIFTPKTNIFDTSMDSDPIADLVDQLGNIWDSMKNPIKVNLVTPKALTRDQREQQRILGGFATGGTVPESGAYMLHKGETVNPTYYNRTKSGGSREVIVNVYGLTMDDAIDKIKFELGRAVRKDLIME